MGTDIHPAIEYRETSTAPWKALLVRDPMFGKYSCHEKEFTANLHIDRDYDLFAVLGNVRNGRRFSGIKTGEGFNPMSDCRGVPKDISDEAREALRDGHSATWVTLSEILAYDWDRSSKHQGVVSVSEFEEWERCKDWNPEPKSWCGGISGPRIAYISPSEMRSIVKGVIGEKRGSEYQEALATLRKDHGNKYTRIEWETSYTSDTKQMWTNILPKMLNLGRDYGFDNVRLVMDFDS